MNLTGHCPPNQYAYKTAWTLAWYESVVTCTKEKNSWKWGKLERECFQTFVTVSKWLSGWFCCNFQGLYILVNLKVDFSDTAEKALNYGNSQHLILGALSPGVDHAPFGISYLYCNRLTGRKLNAFGKNHSTAGIVQTMPWHEYNT